MCFTVFGYIIIVRTKGAKAGVEHERERERERRDQTRPEGPSSGVAFFSKVKSFVCNDSTTPGRAGAVPKSAALSGSSGSL